MLDSGTTLERAIALDALLIDDQRHGERLKALGTLEPSLLAALVSAEYDRLEIEANAVEIVWTGPILNLGFNVRTTSSVIRAIVAEAEDSILLAGYTLDLKTLLSSGLFAALNRGLDVRVIANFADMKDDVWQALVANGASVSLIRFGATSLAKFHVKALVADNKTALVTSANFTKLAQRDNVELGVLMRGDVASRISKTLMSYASAFAAPA